MIWIAGLFAALSLNFFLLYWKGVKERNHLTTFIIFLLLEEEAYRNKREQFRELVANAEAENALELNDKVRSSVANLAGTLASSITLACHSMLWKLKQDGPRPAPGRQVS